MHHKKSNLTVAFLACLLMALWGCSSKKSKPEPPDDIKEVPEFTPIKLTSGPKQHWFGYYDKIEVSPTGRYVLACEVDTIHRSPTNEDVLKVGMIDLEDGNKWIELGESRSWGWQQGCMLQWIPGSSNEIIWNDIKDGKFVSHVMNVDTRERRTLPKAIYTLSNDGTFALGTEFNRIQNMRPGYGYPGVEDPYADKKAPEGIGIYKMDITTGKVDLLISLKEIASIPNLGENLDDYWHYFNHLLISPDDKRFIFLHRWRQEMYLNNKRATGGFTTRMFTANTDGSDKYMLDPSGNTSHFIWKDNQSVCMWTKPVGMESGFYLFTDKTDKVVAVGEGIMTHNGHNTYLPNTNGDWILNDTYPQGEQRLQSLYLYHVPTRKKVLLGEFHEPAKYKGEVRCDLHPRSSIDGRYIIFDSTHGGDGRQMYLIDLKGFIK